jgi:predicted NAD/FAD-binding protein
VPTKASDMSFSVSLDNGGLEYGGANLKSWFAQPRNLFNGRFWSMLKDLYRFYRMAPAHACALDSSAISLGDYLDAHHYAAAFSGRRSALTDAAILRTVLAHPMLALAVLAAIHWEAIRLLLKGLQLKPRPPAPAESVTVVR